MVEQHPVKVMVAGSSPASGAKVRTMNNRGKKPLLSFWGMIIL